MWSRWWSVLAAFIALGIFIVTFSALSTGSEQHCTGLNCHVLHPFFATFKLMGAEPGVDVVEKAAGGGLIEEAIDLPVCELHKIKRLQKNLLKHPSIITNCTQTGLPFLESKYTVRKTLGGGWQAEAKLLTEDTPPYREFVGRFPARPLNTSTEIKEYSAMVTSDVATGLTMCGIPHMMQLADVMCSPTGAVTLVWGRCKGSPLIDLLTLNSNSGTSTNHDGISKSNKGPSCPDIELPELKNLMLQLVQAVDYLRSLGLWHSDLHPENILYERSTGSVCVIDYGRMEAKPVWFDARGKVERAEKYMYDKIMKQPRGKGRIYRDDVLALGTILATLLSVPEPMPEFADMKKASMHFLYYWNFRSLVKVLGLHHAEKYAAKHGLKLPEVVMSDTASLLQTRKRKWRDFENECNKELLTEDAMDLLDKMMRYSYFERQLHFVNITQHPFFTF